MGTLLPFDSKPISSLQVRVIVVAFATLAAMLYESGLSDIKFFNFDLSGHSGTKRTLVSLT